MADFASDLGFAAAYSWSNTSAPIPVFVGNIGFDVGATIVEEPKSGFYSWLFRPSKTVERSIQTLSIEDFVSDSESFLLKADFRKLISAKVKGKGLEYTSNNLTPDSNQDLQSGLNALKENLSGQLEKNNYTDDIYIHASTSNHDFHLELTLDYNQERAANKYSVIGILRAIPNEFFPSEGESEKEFDSRLDQIPKTLLADNDKLKAFDDEYSPKLIALMKSYSQLIKESFEPERMSLSVSSSFNTEVRWSAKE